VATRRKRSRSGEDEDAAEGRRELPPEVEPPAVAAAHIRYAVLEGPDLTDDVATLVGRILALAERADQLNTDPTLAPGIEVLCRVARNLLDADILGAGEVRARHADALDALDPASAALALDSALREAAEIDTPELVRQRHPRSTYSRRLSDEDRDQLAIQCIRGRMGSRLPASVTDESLFVALNVYRRRPSTARCGRPRKGSGQSTDAACVAAVARIMGCDTRTIANHRRAWHARMRRLATKL